MEAALENDSDHDSWWASAVGISKGYFNSKIWNRSCKWKPELERNSENGSEVT